MHKELYEGLKFIVVGIIAVFTDFAFYSFLIGFGITFDISKLLSFILGAIVGFILNKNWTFNSSAKVNREIVYFSLLYFISLNVNVFSNKIVLQYTQLKFLSFLVATTLSTIINYIGQKYIVFRKALK